MLADREAGENRRQHQRTTNRQGIETLEQQLRVLEADRDKHEHQSNEHKRQTVLLTQELKKAHSESERDELIITEANSFIMKLEQEALVTYKKEWTYLQQLEHTYQRGGWCVPHYPLWATSKTPLDSCALAAEWGVEDWSAWHGGCGTRLAYKTYVQETVEQRCLCLWHMSVEPHLLPLPYLSHSGTVRQDLALARNSGVPWHSLMLQRSLSRLRANLICFGHLQHRRSRASRQRCILCNEPSLSLTLHVLCRCEKTAYLRRMCWATSGVDIPESRMEQARKLLHTHPEHPGYGALLAMAGTLDRDSKMYWASEQ